MYTQTHVETRERVRNILIIGSDADSLHLYSQFLLSPLSNVYIRAFLDPFTHGDQYFHKNVPVYRGIEALEPLLQAHTIDEVVLNTTEADELIEHQINRVCVTHGIPVSVSGHRPIDDHQDHQVEEHLKAKRVADLIFAAFAMILFSPLFVMLWFFLLLEGRSPVLSRHKIYGINRSVRVLYRFRTYGQATSGKTSILGKVLSRTGFADLPLLFNVWRGDLSLIGPKPEHPVLADYYARFVPEYNKRFLVTPGLTGLAQTSYRFNDSVRDLIEQTILDIEYVRQARSFSLNSRILWQTFTSPGM